MNATALPTLRKDLRARIEEIERLLAPAFEREATFPGLVNVWSHTCGRAGCRCQAGEKHRSIRLCIQFQDGMAQRSISEDQAESWRERTEAYRRMRQASRVLRRWHQEVAELLTSIERARRCTDGLTPADQGKPLR